jgi:hypothetical protein
MKILIENYRKWEIYFDTDSEEFYTLSNQYDKENTKKSFASTKKYIDDYIKENSSFKPVMVQKFETTFSSAEIIKLVGIRKDNKFMYEDKNGKIKQLSTYDEKNYFLVNTENDKIELKIKELLVDKDKIIRQVKEMEKRLIKVDVIEIRESILGKEYSK